jgi:hypothetical protein
MIAVLALAGCKKQPSVAPPSKEELAACDGGDGKKCFLVAERYHYADPPDLDSAIEYWKRGCERGHGASCGQLGTVVEFGLAGRKANPVVARSFYRRGCDGGDQQSCRSLGVAPTRPSFDWKAALDDVCGPARGQLGPLFAGVTLGPPLPADAQQRIAAWRARTHGDVHYLGDDPSIIGLPSLTVRFDEPKGLPEALAARWGAPDGAWGSWFDAEHHLIANVIQDGRTSAIDWLPYRSVEELVRADDPTRLGFEPIALIGARVDDLRAALGARLHRTSEHGYQWAEAGIGPLTLFATEERGRIVRADANVITNSPRVTQALVDALTAKYGAPKSSRGRLTWRARAGTTISTEPPTQRAGGLTLVLTR